MRGIGLAADRAPARSTVSPLLIGRAMARHWQLPDAQWPPLYAQVLAAIVFRADEAVVLPLLVGHFG